MRAQCAREASWNAGVGEQTWKEEGQIVAWSRSPCSASGTARHGIAPPSSQTEPTRARLGSRDFRFQKRHSLRLLLDSAEQPAQRVPSAIAPPPIPASRTTHFPTRLALLTLAHSRILLRRPSYHHHHTIFRTALLALQMPPAAHRLHLSFS